MRWRRVRCAGASEQAELPAGFLRVVGGEVVAAAGRGGGDVAVAGGRAGAYRAAGVEPAGGQQRLVRGAPGGLEAPVDGGHVWARRGGDHGELAPAGVGV